MPTFTKKLNLRKPEESDYYNEQTEQAENWQKIDDYAEQMDNDKLDKGGYEGTGLDLNNLIFGNTGITKVRNIQDIGTKVKGEIYWDNSVTPKVPYLCVKTTEDITPTSNFVAADNKNLAKDVYEETFSIEIGNPVQYELKFRKVGKIVNVFCTTKGGSITTIFDKCVIPENFRPLLSTYITYPCVSGTPYIHIASDGKLSSYDNGATMHTLQSITSYFMTQSYIAANNLV